MCFASTPDPIKIPDPPTAPPPPQAVRIETKAKIKRKKKVGATGRSTLKNPLMIPTGSGTSGVNIPNA